MEENSEQQPATPMPPPPQVPPQKQPPGLVGEVPPASREAMSPVQRGRGRGRNSGDGRGGSGRGGRSGRGRTGAGGRTIHDPNARGRGRGRNQPQNNQGTTQKIAPNTGIPFGHVPAYLPGSSSLVEELDQRSMVVLRDGRHIVGKLRTFDQFSNMVLDEASERRFHSSDSNDNDEHQQPKVTYFTDIPLGLYIVRGDSVVLLGQINPEEEDETIQQGTVIMKKLDEEAFEAMVQGDDEGDEDESADEAAKGSHLEWDFDKDLLA